MGNKKGNTQGTTGTVVPPTTQGNPPCVLVPTTKSTPVLRGTSTVNNPVGMVWVTGFNLYFNPNGTPVTPTPTRKQFYNMCTNLGVTHYTVRTQTQRFLKYTGGGTYIPTTPTNNGVNLPKGVTWCGSNPLQG